MGHYPDPDTALEPGWQDVTGYITKPIEPERLLQAIASGGGHHLILDQGCGNPSIGGDRESFAF